MVYHKGEEEGRKVYGGNRTGKSREAVKNLGTGLGRQRGYKRTRDNVRYKHAERGAEISIRGWRGAVVDGVQVDGIPCQEMRWVAGETERCYDGKLLLVEGVSMEEGKENNPETVQTSGAGADIISVNY